MSPAIQVRQIGVFSGPSRFAPWPCVATRLVFPDRPADGAVISRIATAASRVLPEMPIREGDLRDGPSSTALGQLVGRLSIGLQSRGLPRIERLSASGAGASVQLAIGYSQANIALAAISAAVRWVDAALQSGGDVDAEARVDAFLRSVAPQLPTLEQRLVLGEVQRRGIPWSRISGAYRFGWGASQRWFGRTMTDRTPTFSVSWATHKPSGAAIMASAGIPVPVHAIASSPEQAVRIARRIGYPVVMKPARSDMGVGVRLGLRDASDVERTFPEVRQHGEVVVQRQHAGSDHRLLVVDGRLVAAALRTPARILGDGSSTVRALVEAINSDPRRGENHAELLTRISIDDEANRVLARQGLDLDAVPEAGREVRLRMTANLSTGGTAEDVTDRVHPDNRMLVERAARVIGLDLAGIDFLSEDIGRSHLDIGGVVCEINPNPGFRPHLAAPGSPDVVHAVVDAMFPGAGDGRIPAALVTGTVGKTTTCRMVAAILRAAGHTVGLASTDGVQIDDARIRNGDEAGPRGAAIVLSDRSVTAAVLETARGGILEYGIGPDRYSVGAVLNVGADHVGTDGIGTSDDLARVKSLVLAGATRAWVLNADDPRCLAMARGARGPEVILAGRDAGSTAIVRHLAAGGRAVVLSGEGASARLVGLRGRDTLVSMAVRSIPATHDGAAEFNVDNARHAVAIALGLGIGAEAIVAGLGRFASDARWSPARANLHRIGPLTVLIDYAHNAESFEAISRFAMRLDAPGSRALIVDAPGNRPDTAFEDIAASVADRFDRFICTTSLPRGRPAGEVSRLLAQSLLERGVAPGRITEVEPFDDALELMLRTARAGDLLVIPADTPDQVLGHPACRRWAGLAEPAR